MPTNIIFNSPIINNTFNDNFRKHAFTFLTPNFYSFVKKVTIRLVPEGNVPTNYQVSFMEGDRMSASSLNSASTSYGLKVFSTNLTSSGEYVMDQVATSYGATRFGTQSGLKPNTRYTAILEPYNTNKNGKTYIYRGEKTGKMMAYNDSSQWVSLNYGINMIIEGITTDGGKLIYRSTAFNVKAVNGGQVDVYNSGNNFTLNGYKPSDGKLYNLETVNHSFVNGDYAAVAFAGGITIEHFKVSNGVASNFRTPSPNSVFDNINQYYEIYSFVTNTIPTNPGEFTKQPISSSVNLSGETINLQWPASSDPDGDSIKYTLEFYNGSSWNVIASNLTTLTYLHTLPSMNATNTQYRVKAVDAKGGESAYRTSNVFTVRKQLLLIKDRDSTKTFKNNRWETI